MASALIEVRNWAETKYLYTFLLWSMTDLWFEILKIININKDITINSVLEYLPRYVKDIHSDDVKYNYKYIITNWQKWVELFHIYEGRYDKIDNTSMLSDLYWRYNRYDEKQATQSKTKYIRSVFWIKNYEYKNDVKDFISIKNNNDKNITTST